MLLPGFRASLPRTLVSSLGASKELGETLVKHLSQTEWGSPHAHASSTAADAAARVLVSPAVAPQLRTDAKAVVVVTDAGIRDLGLELPALDSLATHGFEPYLFDSVVANPTTKNVLDATAFCRQVRASCVVGLGGGSSMDVAKLAAFLAMPGQHQRLDDLYGVGKLRGGRLPLVQIPTTAGTGSEVTPISIVTAEHEKKGVVSPQLIADVAVLDGELTLGLPQPVTAATGVDACVHAIEAMTSRVLRNPFSDSFAREGLRLLGANLRAVCTPQTSRDANARQAMLLGSAYAGVAFANSPVGAVHALAYPVGSLFNVPHGVSISLVLPHVLRFNSKVEYASKVYAEVQGILFPDVSPKQADLATCFEVLAKDLKLPTKLTDVGVSAKDLDALVDGAMAQTRLLPNNARDVSRTDARVIFEQAM